MGSRKEKNVQKMAGKFTDSNKIRMFHAEKRNLSLIQKGCLPNV